MLLIQVVLAVGFSIQDIKSMISRNGMSKEEHVSLVQNKIAQIEAAQQKLNESKQSLHDILNSGISCERGFGKY
ncbi:MerR family DNA-binding protein [Paenibacillus sp. FSL W7-1279]|uniref:MerR family DNA-binding protein n=2 Tax=Paenibacillus TaxID=44249 RepID=UPI0009421F7F